MCRIVDSDDDDYYYDDDDDEWIQSDGDKRELLVQKFSQLQSIATEIVTALIFRPGVCLYMYVSSRRYICALFSI